MNDSTVDDSPSTATSRPLVFGEVLIDVFPDGREILGGAPFNVAWNLQGFGQNPLFISAIGSDDLGARVRDTMSSWGMDQTGLQILDDRPTGTVQVSLDGDGPSFDIVPDQAYDHIEPSTVATSIGQNGLFYHGSLIFRSESSRQTLRQLIAECQLPRFVDINIRPPHFETQWLSELLQGACWVKLNDDELQQLSGVELGDRGDIERAVQQLRGQFGNATYFVTCGADGAYVIDSENVVFAEAPTPSVFSDSVGAGDAFAAATITGILTKRSTCDSLNRAVEFASRVCGIRGATSTSHAIYKENDS